MPTISKSKKTVVAVLLAFLAFFAAMPVWADSYGLDETVKGLDVSIKNNQDLSSTAGKIIGVFLSMLGVIFICLVVYAGYLWMTAAGDNEKVKKAKDILQSAIIGVIIVSSAYVITYFVLFYSASDKISSAG